MPEIARFYGLIVKMYLRSKDHNPPHIHILYGEYAGVYELDPPQMVEGDLPRRAQNLAMEWIKQNQAALLEIWNTQNFRHLPPLD